MAELKCNICGRVKFTGDRYFDGRIIYCPDLDCAGIMDLVEEEEPTQIKSTGKEMRKFDTGATRDSNDGKLDYEGFLSPAVLHRYAKYLHKHRKQSDGRVRDSDNWQKGIPLDVYMKSKLRHFMDTWLFHRGLGDLSECENIQEALCAELFNTMGMLFEILKGEAKND